MSEADKDMDTSLLPAVQNPIAPSSGADDNYATGEDIDAETELQKFNRSFNSAGSARSRSVSKGRARSVDSQPVYEPDPIDAKDRKSILTGVAGYIIVTEFCERLAYYGFAGSLVLFFQTQLHYTNEQADEQYSAWSGVCYVTPLLGGYIADTYLGRYKTILVFCSVYLVGLVMVVLGSIPGKVSPEVFFPAIYIIALGTGGIKPNVSTMGADQFDERYSQDRKEKESFFNWFYWSINLGALISYTLVAYICQYGLVGLGGEEWGFFVGYTIPGIMMSIAILIFLAGTPKYRKAPPPQGSVLEIAAKVCWEAIWTRRGVKTDGEHTLDRSKRSYGGSFSDATVEGVKLVTRLTPYIAIMIPFWGIYSQMSTAFQNQGCQMDVSLGGANVPVSALNSFDTVAILLLVPVFDGVVYPYCKKIGYPLSMLQKIGWGFAFSMVSMFVAAMIEIYRVSKAPPAGNYYDDYARTHISPCQNIDNYNPYDYQDWAAGGLNGVDDEPLFCSQTCNDYYTSATGVQMLNLTCISCDDIPQYSDISVFWQVPQFMLIGTSEILAAITSLEFFYSQAPMAMRSVSQSLNLFTNALGAWLVIPLLLMVNSNPSSEWVPTNLDDGHLDWYFFLLAALMACTMVVFYFISKDYVYKTDAELAINIEAADADSQQVEPYTSPPFSHHDESKQGGGDEEVDGPMDANSRHNFLSSDK